MGTTERDGAGSEVAPQEGSDEDSEGTAAVVRNFGADASGGQRAAVVGTLRSYFRALADENYRSACAHFTRAYRRTLARALSGGDAGGSCREVGRAMREQPDLPTGDAVATVAAEILRVGIEGSNATVVYRPRKGTASFLTLVREGGSWKTTSLAGAPLQ